MLGMFADVYLGKKSPQVLHGNASQCFAREIALELGQLRGKLGFVAVYGVKD
jgi:hypothetical protein